MANIQKRGDTYRIRVSCGVDASGKQIFRSKTWKPTPGMTDRQREKEADRQAILFEEECKAGAYTLSGSIKFQTFAEQWFREAASKTNKPLSLKRLHSYEKRTYAALGHLRMDKITTPARGPPTPPPRTWGPSWPPVVCRRKPLPSRRGWAAPRCPPLAGGSV